MPQRKTSSRTSLPIGSTTIEIALAAMQFHVRVGILPHERELPQPLEIDLIVRHSAGGGAVLDYRTLYDITRAVVEEGKLDYLEAIADRIASRVLALDDVAFVRVVLRKPQVALGGPLAHAQVALERARD